MISGIQLSSSRMVIPKEDTGSRKNLPELKLNQIIKAKVLQPMPGGRTLLSFQNQTITTQTSLLLKPGEEIMLKVASLQDEIVFKLVGPVKQLSGSQMSSLASLFMKNTPVRDIMESRIPAVKTLLNEVALKSGKSDTDFLPRLMEKSGVLLERKIADIVTQSRSGQDIPALIKSMFQQDIKGNLLKTLMAEGALERSQASGVFKTEASFLDTLNSLQLLNHQSSESGRFLLPFPVLSEAGFHFGQLLIDVGKKEKNRQDDSDRTVRISFILDMSRLGPLKADFSIFKKDITGKFLFLDNDTSRYVDSLMPQLKERLKAVEYNLVKVECQTVEKAQTDPAFFLKDLVLESDDRVLNIVI